MKDKIKKLFDTKTTRGKIMRTGLFLLILVLIFVVTYSILKVTGAWEKVNSIDKIRDIVQSGGVFSFLIFIIFQILQTTILQIPAIFVTIAGAVIFGRWPAFIMSYIAVMIGSLIMFWVGRKAGRKFLNWMIGKDSSEKWIDRMSRGKYLFFLMMLFPMFPDDILCVVAGLTNMSFSFFFWTNILARGVGIACTVFFGSGAIIPFHGWGLIVWAIIIVVIAILFYLSVRYKSKIDDIIKLLFKRSRSDESKKDFSQVEDKKDLTTTNDKNKEKSTIIDQNVNSESIDNEQQGENPNINAVLVEEVLKSTNINETSTDTNKIEDREVQIEVGSTNLEKDQPKKKIEIEVEEAKIQLADTNESNQNLKGSKSDAKLASKNGDKA